MTSNDKRWSDKNPIKNIYTHNHMFSWKLPERYVKSLYET